MINKLEMYMQMKEVYEKQVDKLKHDWKNGVSRFCKVKDYKYQLSIWEKRIQEYEIQINALRK